MGSVPQSMPVAEIAACVAEVLGIDASVLDLDASLSELGLESFSAVRLRRRLRDDVGLELPLTAFLGGVTVRMLAAGAIPADEAARSGGDASFALTPIQAAYLVGRDPAFPLGGVATFFYVEYDRVPQAEPDDDLRRLEEAWNQLIRRHPMLRMVVGADARQRVLERVPWYAFAVTDLRSAGPEKVEQTLAELRADCSHQLRPADAWPLFDIRASLLPDGRTRLYVGVDVLALDLASWFRLMREWGILVADPDPDLPDQPFTFDELIRRREDDPDEVRRREHDQAYWTRRAETLPAGPALPWAREPAELGVPRFTRHAAGLDAAEWTALRERAAGHGLSPTGVLLAALGLVLNRWGATAPFCLNTTLFDRADAAGLDDTPGLEAVVGDFTSTVLVELPPPDLQGWAGFAPYAAEINRRFWTDLDHRSVSGVEALRNVRGPELTPAYPVVFTSGVGLSGAGDPPTAWLGSEVFGVSQTPQVLLDHIVWDEGGRLRIAWDAVEGALPEGFVGGMRAAHTRLLRRLATEGKAWSDPALGWDPSFLADEQLDAVPFGDTGPLLDDPLRAMAEDAPQAPALLSAGASVTHGELAAAARRTGAVLSAAGLGPDDLVAVAAEKSIPQVTALLGVAASGAGYVPVEPSWPADRVASLCAQAAVRHALAAPGVDLAWPDDVTVHRLEPDGTLTGLDASVEPSRPAPDHLAYAIFTSGSTGKPKGVAVEHRAVRTTLDDLADRFPLLPQDRVLGLSAFSFDLSVYDTFSVLGAGGAVVLPDADRQRDPGHWLELMAAHRVTVWNTAPALMEMLVEYAEIDPEQARAALAPLRLVLLSADWIPVGLPDRIRAIAPDAQVISLGGATEGSIWSICFPIGTVAPGWKSIPYGRALRGQSFHIIDDAGRPCPVGVPGELHIGGDGLARGYVGDPEQTAHRFSDHTVLRRRLYRTGDLGRWRLDGTIEFLGRVDRQVKIRGHRIELGEVESVLERAPGVRNVVAKSVPGPDDRPRLVAYVVPSDPGRPPADDELFAMLRRSVPDFMMPSRFVRMRRFPVTANGKVDYAQLRNPYRRGGDDTATAPAVAPGPHPAEPTSPTVVPSMAARAAMPAERAPAEPGDGRLEELLSTGVAEGLGLTLTLTAGALPPGEALAAAARCSDRIRRLAVTRGLPLAERLPDNGLLEMILGAADPNLPPGPTAAPVDSRPRRAAPAAPTIPVPALPVQAPAPVPESATADIPDPEVERAIARVLSDLLKAPVDVKTPFFRLGATSLTLVLAHKRLAADLDPGLAVVDMFAHSTVRNLALLITRRRHGGVHATGAPGPDSGGGTPPNGDGGPPPDSSGASPNTRPSRRQARAIAAEVAR